MRTWGLRLVLSSLIFALCLVSPARLFASPTIATDQSDYSPHEIVVVTGSGFAPDALYDIPVTRPDGSIVKGDGSFMSGWDTVQADSSGGFIYYYQLDGIEGTYLIEVYDSPWPGSGLTPLASLTFTDAFQESHEQLRNVTPEWHTGNLGGTNSSYVEGDSVPYRYEFKDVPANACLHFEIHYDFTQLGDFAFDFLTDFDRTESGPIASAGGLFGGTPLTGLAIGDCNTTAVAIPNDLNISTDDLVIGAEGTQYFTICGAFVSASTSVLSGPTHPSDVSGNSEKFITLQIKKSSATGDLAIAWGGHLAIGDAVNWGAGNGSASISGSPFHQNGDGFLDVNCNGEEDNPDDKNLGAGNRSVGNDVVVEMPDATETPTEVPATETPTQIPVPTDTPTEVPVPTDTPTEIPVPTDTPTQVPVPTDTPTEVAVPTDTPTEVPVPTDTPTEVPVPTDTPTEIPVPTDTPTQVPVPTDTPTQVPVPTDTPTEVAVPTDTPTEVPVPTDTPTEVPIPTDTPTEIPVATDTPTEVPVPTDTPTEVPVPTDTPTEIPVATDTPTEVPVPTDTPTEVPVPTDTPTEIPVATDTPTEVPVPTDTPTEVPVPTDTPTEIPVATDTPTEVPVPTDTPTEVPVPTDTPTEIPVATDTPTEVPVPTDTPTVQLPSETPTVPPTSTPTATSAVPSSTPTSEPLTPEPLVGPDFTIKKSHSGFFTPAQGGAYSLVIRNLGDDGAGPITVVDPLPDGLTKKSIMAPGWNCQGSTAILILCVHPGPLMATDPPLVITVLVNVAPNPKLPIKNVATVSAPNDIDESNNSDDDIVSGPHTAPALSEVGMLALAVLLFGIGLLRLRRRQVT